MRHTEFFRSDNHNSTNSNTNNSNTFDGRGQQTIQSQPSNPSASSMNLMQQNPIMRVTMMNSMSASQSMLMGAQGVQQRKGEGKLTVAGQLQELAWFVNQHVALESPITMKQMSSPSSKQFSSVFWGLLKLIDPHVKQDAVPLEEIPTIMKFWNYPHQLNKNMFITLGAPHTWHHLQNLLLWLFAIVKDSMANDATNAAEAELKSIKQQSDMEILNAYIARSFRRREQQYQLQMSSSVRSASTKKNKKLNTSILLTSLSDDDQNSGMNSNGFMQQQQQQQQQYMYGGVAGNGSNEVSEQNEIAEKLRVKNVQLLESIREFEVKIETMKLAAKNLCMKQPELSEISSKIEQQSDLISMENEIITQLVDANESQNRRLDTLNAALGDRLTQIHELSLAKKRIQQLVIEQEYSIKDADKKAKEIERLRIDKARIEESILQSQDERISISTSIEAQLSDIATMQDEYNRILHQSSELFLSCKDIQLVVSFDRLRSESILSVGNQENEEQAVGAIQNHNSMVAGNVDGGFVQQQQEQQQQIQQAHFSQQQQQVWMSSQASKQVRKRIIKGLVNIDLKQTGDRLRRLVGEYAGATREKEEQMKVIQRQIDDKQAVISEMAVKEKQLQLKVQQKTLELKAVSQSFSDRQTAFSDGTSKLLIQITNLNGEVAELTAREASAEADLTNLMNSIEEKKVEIAEQREAANAIVDAQALKLSNLKVIVKERLANLRTQIATVALAQQQQQQQQIQFEQQQKKQQQQSPLNQ